MTVTVKSPIVDRTAENLKRDRLEKDYNSDNSDGLEDSTEGNEKLNDDSNQDNQASEHRIWTLSNLKWINIFVLLFIHALAVKGICMMFQGRIPFKSFAFSYFWGYLTGIGVTAGAHRYYTHRSYQCSKLLQLVHLVLYFSSGQNSLFQWVRDHRLHHKYSDTDMDPHNANRGFFFSHMGWLLVKRHPAFLEKARGLDMSDILNDPMVQFFERNFELCRLLGCFVFPITVNTLYFGLPLFEAICLDVGMKYCTILHGIWSVNSAAHIFGYRPYDKRILPSQNWLVSSVALGEGWHNYHHVFPWDYRASEGGYFLNLTLIWLDTWDKLGQIYEKKVLSPELVEKVKMKHGEKMY